MGRWIERRHKRQRRERRLEALWGWPHSIWYVLWLAVFFGQFFFRLGTIWFVPHGEMASPSFSTLPESIALRQAYDHLSTLANPEKLAMDAAELGDFRTLSWGNLRYTRVEEPRWVFVPWPVRAYPVAQIDDRSYIVVKDAIKLCSFGRISAGSWWDASQYGEEPSSGPPLHLLSGTTDFCRAVAVFEESARSLEKSRFSGQASYLPREVIAYYVRFMSFLHSYNKALMQHPSAPSALSNLYRLNMKYNDLDYPLYQDYLDRLVPPDKFKRWTDWD